MDYRNLFGIGFIILSTAALVHSFRPANASMPVGMQHGQFPYQNFDNCDLPGSATYWYGCEGSNLSNGDSATLLTVPSDRIFVVTGGVTNYSYNCTFHIDGVPLFYHKFHETDYSNQTKVSPFLTGNTHITVPAGSELQLYLGNSGCRFFIEGYYAHI